MGMGQHEMTWEHAMEHILRSMQTPQVSLAVRATR